jgi:energy-converting hydrogenase Eha subunit A
MDHRSSRLFWGFALLIVGSAMLLAQLGILPDVFSLIWPLAVIAFGLWLAVRSLARPGAQGLTAGIVVAFAGGFWLGRQFDLVPDSVFFPVVVIALGVGMLLRSLLGRVG